MPVAVERSVRAYPSVIEADSETDVANRQHRA